MDMIPRKFREIALEVLEAKKLKSLNTYKSARVQLNHLILHFGDCTLADITEADWIKYVSNEQHRGKRSFFDSRKYMGMVCLYAFRHGWISRRIRLDIPIDFTKEVGREVRPEELKRLVSRANPQLAFQIQIAYKMGLRLREMLHLEWERFDWRDKVIRLRRVDTKTRRARTVPITPDLYPKFKALHQLSNSPYVFPRRSDSTKPQHDNKSAWIRVKRDLGIECRWHDLRHTCASRLLRAGVSDHVVRKYLGMSSWVLHRIYAHLSDQDLHVAAKVMVG